MQPSLWTALHPSVRPSVCLYVLCHLLEIGQSGYDYLITNNWWSNFEVKRSKSQRMKTWNRFTPTGPYLREIDRSTANQGHVAFYTLSRLWMHFNHQRKGVSFAIFVCLSVCHMLTFTQNWKWNVLGSSFAWINGEVILRTKTYLLRLSSSRSDQNIGRQVVSIWHGRWQYLSRHSHQHPVCPDLPSVCLAMSSLVFRPSSCHLLVSTLWPDYSWAGCRESQDVPNKSSSSGGYCVMQCSLSSSCYNFVICPTNSSQVGHRPSSLPTLPYGPKLLQWSTAAYSVESLVLTDI